MTFLTKVYSASSLRLSFFLSNQSCAQESYTPPRDDLPAVIRAGTGRITARLLHLAVVTPPITHSQIVAQPIAA